MAQEPSAEGLVCQKSMWPTHSGEICKPISILLGSRTLGGELNN